MTAPLAQRLLDAHVAHLLNRLEKDQLPHEVEKLVDQVLGYASKIKLTSIVNKKDITATAKHYAANMDIGPGIPELVAEIAREVYQHKAHDDATLNDVISDQDFDEMLDKFSEMKELRERLIHEAISNPVYSALVSELLYNGISRYINDNPLTNKLPGAKSMLKLGKSMIEKAAGPNLEDGIKKYLKHNTRIALNESERFLLQQLEEGNLNDNMRRYWDKGKTVSVSRFRKYVREDDVEEFFVIGFEFWKKLRKTQYYANLIEAGVEFFFKKYGKSSLQTILDEMGVDREMILNEAQRYAPKAVAELNKLGIIEDIARSQLGEFYLSDEAKKILGEK